MLSKLNVDSKQRGQLIQYIWCTYTDVKCVDNCCCFYGNKVNFNSKFYKQNNIFVAKKKTFYENIDFKLVVNFYKLIY